MVGKMIGREGGQTVPAALKAVEDALNGHVCQHPDCTWEQQGVGPRTRFGLVVDHAASPPSMSLAGVGNQRGEM